VRVLQDADLRARLAEEGRRYAAEWSSLAMARRLQELYRSIIPQSGLHAAAADPLPRALTNSAS
jgi:hypothetical protein